MDNIMKNIVTDQEMYVDGVTLRPYSSTTRYSLFNSTFNLLLDIATRYSTLQLDIQPAT